MEAKQILDKIKILDEEKKKMSQLKDVKKKKREESKNDFLRCEIQCCCEENVCRAKGLRQCDQCLDVLKSSCTKKRCKEHGVTMKKPHCDRPKEILRVSDVYTSNSD